MKCNRSHGPQEKNVVTQRSDGSVSRVHPAGGGLSTKVERRLTFRALNRAQTRPGRRDAATNAGEVKNGFHRSGFTFGRFDRLDGREERGIQVSLGRAVVPNTPAGHRHGRHVGIRDLRTSPECRRIRNGSNGLVQGLSNFITKREFEGEFQGYLRICQGVSFASAS